MRHYSKGPGESVDGTNFIPKTLATQPEEDGGLGHTDFECRLEAAWADLVLSLAGRQEVWKEMWIRELEEVYGGLDCRDMGHTTCGFHKYMRDGRGSEILRRGLAALAKLPPPEGRVEINGQEAEGEGEGVRTMALEGIDDHNRRARTREGVGRAVKRTMAVRKHGMWVWASGRGGRSESREVPPTRLANCGCAGRRAARRRIGRRR